MKKHLVLRIMLAFAVICLHNVASAALDHSPTGVVCYVADDVSTIAEAPTVEPVTVSFYPSDFIAADSYVFRQPDVSYIDRYLLKLPDQDKLPPENIWLRCHQIRLC